MEPSRPLARGRPRAWIACLLVGWAAHEAFAAGRANGFVLEPSSVPVDEIVPGGPPRDGIPALDDPKILAAGDSAWPDEELVIGVATGGLARAYPLSILIWHELVNDELGGSPLLVSYCPLCGTGVVFDRRIRGSVHRFGVSGLLYRSDLLMFDRSTESLWSQISARAVTGELRDQRLRLLRSRITTWARWRAAHPGTSVLSPETGYRRDYGRTPYEGYDRSAEVFFPVGLDPRFHPKTPTVGLRSADGTARAYPADELEKAGGAVEEDFAGGRVRIRYDSERRLFDVRAPASLEVIEGFWFAWAAFHPATSVFTAPARSR